MQTRLQSFIESCINILIGFGIALVTQIIIFPIYNVEVNTQTHIEITLWFTLVSVIRSYFVRRWFDWKIRKSFKEFRK